MVKSGKAESVGAAVDKVAEITRHLDQRATIELQTVAYFRDLPATAAAEEADMENALSAASQEMPLTSLSALVDAARSVPRWALVSPRLSQSERAGRLRPDRSIRQPGRGRSHYPAIRAGRDWPAGAVVAQGPFHHHAAEIVAWRASPTPAIGFAHAASQSGDSARVRSGFTAA